MISASRPIRVTSIILISLLVVLLAPAVAGDEQRPLTLQDMMKFRKIRSPRIAEDGSWVACEVRPDRGDGAVEVRSASGAASHTIERGSNPDFSRDGRFVFATLLPEAVELAKKKKDEDKTKNGLAILDLSSGEIARIDKVRSYAVSRDSMWVAMLHHPEKKKLEEKKKRAKETRGRMVLRHLPSGEEISFDSVVSMSFDPESRVLVYVSADDEGAEHHLRYLDLEDRGRSGGTLARLDDGRFTQLAWVKEMGRLAYLRSLADEEGKTERASLWTWDTTDRKPSEAATQASAPEGWFLPTANSVSWSRDGERLFFGFKPEDPDEDSQNEEGEQEEIDLFDIDALLDKREIDVWHWDDPFIIPQQKIRWPKEKERTYMAVFHHESRKVVPLADLDMPSVIPYRNPRRALGRSDVPYRKEVTWDGNYNDLYVVDLQDGSRRKVATHIGGLGLPALSPEGRYLVYYDQGDWHRFDCDTGATQNLTGGLDIPFANEDHDYPSDPPGYGVGGWVENDSAVLIYDKYDIWQFPMGDGKAFRVTGGHGRTEKWVYRVLRLDPDKLFFEDGERLLLSAYHDLRKERGFAEAHAGREGVEPALGGRRRHDIVAKAKEADTILYTRQSYAEFPDLWVADPRFETVRKLTDANPQIAEFAWGEAELVEWTTPDNIPLQGVLIKPGNYEQGKRYPVLVYYYRLFSQRLHDFNQIVVNHRPCFPFYAGHGYAVFLPDIRFEVGHPGRSATKCLVSGVQKLIDLGIADPDAIGLHGHSWSGYQTAFVITQTDMFKAAVAGAPVSNMTSAYSGIRLTSGLARQFQYEKSQSRIGGSLFDALDLYIENSPVFFADKIKTPLLIMFGDVDGAVPWQQGIELYLAMRRLEKDCIFLQYRGESHHPRKYANKLDYSIKMKEFFDHHLKGAEAPEWMTEGVPYMGK